MILGDRINGEKRCFNKLNVSFINKVKISNHLERDTFTRFFNDLYDEVEVIYFEIDVNVLGFN